MNFRSSVFATYHGRAHFLYKIIVVANLNWFFKIKLPLNAVYRGNEYYYFGIPLMTGYGVGYCGALLPASHPPVLARGLD